MPIRLTLTAAMLLALTACQPSDQKVKTVRERLEAGETVEFTKPGTNTPNCGAAVWSTIKVANKPERDRVIVGSQASILNTGYKFCGKIGRAIDMTVFKGDQGLGQVVVKKISIVKLDFLRPSLLKGKYFSSDIDFDNYKKSIKLYPENLGIVTIIETQYQNGSAVDEKAVREKEDEKSKSDGLEETTEDGKDLSQCSSPWSDLAVADEFQDAVLKGSLGSWYSIGQKNCIRQGQLVNIKSKVGRDEPSKGQLKVIKIRRFRMNFLAAGYFDLRGFDFEKIKTQINRDDKYRDEWITVVDFEAKAGQIKSPVKQLTIPSSDLKGADTVATVQGVIDFKVGELVVVNVIQPGGEVLQLQATVISSMQMTTTTLVRIQFLSGGSK